MLSTFETSESSLDSNTKSYDKPDTTSSNDNLLHHSEISSVGVTAIPLIMTKQRLGDNIFAMPPRNNNVTKNSGFSTAGSRNIIAVSEDSLIKARKSLDGNTNAMFTCNDNESKSFGFSTANGRSLPSISETSLNKARKSLDDITFAKSIHRDNDVLKDSSFSTANGHSITNISDVSLQRARKVLDGDLRQSSILQEKFQSNIIDPCDSELTFNAVGKSLKIYLDKNQSSNSKSRLKETPLIHSRLGSRNKNAKISSKNIVHPLHPNKRRRLHPNVSQESHNSQSKISESNSITKLFNLTSLLKRVRLKDVVSNYPLDFSMSYLQKLGIPVEVINITSKNAIFYRFTWPEGQSQENTKCLSFWGPDEALSCLIESGANPDFINENWVCNHFRWIVWKIASMVRSFPHEFRSWWNPKKVLDQLRYRYEREINNAHRSALKMIIEGDAAASMSMILCVSDIIEEDTSLVIPENNVREDICKITYSLELTDMWYKIRADIDLPLQRAISKSKLRIGCKVEICGAKIVGGPVGIPALEVPNSIRLKLSANSTKLAHWDAKLGFKRVCPYATLRSLCPDGGYIFAIDILIDMSKITSGEQLYEIMQDCLEPSKFWQDLSSEQSEWLQNYIQKKEQEKASHMNDWVYYKLEKSNYTRKVVPFFKVRVCDYHLNTLTNNKCEGIINVWQPDELLFNTIREGRRYKVYSLTTASNQSYQITSLSPIRLSSTKGSTIWKEENVETNSNALSSYSSRTITLLDELQRQELNIEVDVVVYILIVGEPSIGQRFGKAVKIQTLLVTDNSGRLAQIEIKNISTYLEVILKPKNVLILLNLQYRAYDPKYGIYILSTCDNTEIKMSSREEYIKHAKGNLEQWIKNNSNLVNKCEEKAIELCRPNYSSSN
ncbi:9604_t:CDS:10 [Funneliformis caledonium]|uniref:9604_t:CDS:1 n=1 Tax=Funneliformis caledonium TaxID=1117310 RepID=A0A9N9ALM6_9GLOM|nr:9604_t:CDS:10 [Funneliformis caledonium]